jgi:hypothetical protein
VSLPPLERDRVLAFFDMPGKRGHVAIPHVLEVCISQSIDVVHAVSLPLHLTCIYTMSPMNEPLFFEQNERGRGGGANYFFGMDWLYMMKVVCSPQLLSRMVHMVYVVSRCCGVCYLTAAARSLTTPMRHCCTRPTQVQQADRLATCCAQHPADT